MNLNKWIFLAVLMVSCYGFKKITSKPVNSTSIKMVVVDRFAGQQTGFLGNGPTDYFLVGLSQDGVKHTEPVNYNEYGIFQMGDTFYVTGGPPE